MSGIEIRMQEILHKNRKQPNGGLFELLVACCYARAGGQVLFRKERPGKDKSHDMDVVIHGKAWAVECKRMETSAYGEAERSRIRYLWKGACQLLCEKRLSVLMTVNFHVELERVQVDYLIQKVCLFLEGEQTVLEWKEHVSSGSFKYLDLAPLKRLLKTDSVLFSGSKMQSLLTGHYKPKSRILWSLEARCDTSPRYIDDCTLAIVLDWQCTAEASTDAKARSITRHLSKAVSQLPTGVPSVVHIGFETVDSDEVEAARFAKVVSTVSRFDPGSVALEYVFCHYLSPESPPDELFAYDETVQWLSIRPAGRSPLEVGSLVGDSNVDWTEGVHWKT